MLQAAANKTKLKSSVKVQWGLSRGANTAIQIVIALFALAAWELLARLFNIAFWTSSPSAVAADIYHWASTGLLASDLQVTLIEAGLGFLVGSIGGALTGFVFGWIRWLGDLLEPFIVSVYTLPKIALAPLFVLWFGIGMTNKVMFASMLVFFMVFFTTYQGTRQVDSDLVENARLLGARRLDIWTKIAIPYSAVWVFTGIRIGLPYALIGAIVGEFVAADAGVGYRIKEATAFFNTSTVFSGLMVLMIVSLSLLGCLKIVERRVLGWQNARGTIDVDSLA